MSVLVNKERTQFIVMEESMDNRKMFYNYIHKKYELKDIMHSKEYMINDYKYPFVIDINKKTLWVCHSITCCACASQANVIMSINDFKEIMKEK